LPHSPYGVADDNLSRKDSEKIADLKETIVALFGCLFLWKESLWRRIARRQWATGPHQGLSRTDLVGTREKGTKQEMVIFALRLKAPINALRFLAALANAIIQCAGEALGYKVKAARSVRTPKPGGFTTRL
jgi:hypothetical protein